MKNHWLDKSVTELREHYEKELAASEAMAAKGYAQAYEIITDLRNKLEDQREMYEKRLEEGFNEAFELLQKEKQEKASLEVVLYEEYDKKVQDIRKFMVDKVADYLDKKVLEEGAAKVRAENTPNRSLKKQSQVFALTLCRSRLRSRSPTCKRG